MTATKLQVVNWPGRQACATPASPYWSLRSSTILLGADTRRVRAMASAASVRIGGRKTTNVLRGVLACLGLAVLLGACDDGTYAFVADNRTDEPLIARIRLATGGDSVGSAFDVVGVPARARLVIAQQPFAGDNVAEIVILTLDCRAIGEFSSFTTGGALIVIEEGPTASQRKEWPTGPTTAEKSDQCPAQEGSPTE
jgi:hypothetical protein